MKARILTAIFFGGGFAAGWFMSVRYWHFRPYVFQSNWTVKHNAPARIKTVEGAVYECRPEAK